MSNLIEIFKTPIYYEDLELNTKSIKEYCLSFKDKNKSVNKSNMGGWQSDNLEGEHLLLNDLFLEIEKQSNNFTNKIGLKNNLKLINTWININNYKDHNQNHIHPNCLLSGVYYVQTPKDCGNIEFTTSDIDLRSYEWNEKTVIDENNYTVPRWIMPAIENRLYLFPNWLTHCVQPNLNSKKERISISFNIR